MKKTPVNHKSTVYKNKPLVRCDNTIYYGNINEKYIIKLEILSHKLIFNTNVADKVSVQLLCTDPSLKTQQKLIKKCEKDGLYAAIDIAEAWLCKALSEE